jgi:hypothetical protein
MLPIHQVREGKTGATKLLIEPDAEVVQGHLRRQASLKAAPSMGTLVAEAEGMMHFVVDGLNDLAHPGQPAAQPLRPRMGAIPLRRAKNLGPLVVPPSPVCGLALEAFIAEVGAQSRLADAQVSGV